MAKAKVSEGLRPLSKSEQMSRVRSRDTGPELLLRSLLSERGVRYRLHRKDLPGRPDLFIGRLGLAIFVNGCFWHGHECPRGGPPKTNADFWKGKITRNVDRDRRVLGQLREMGVTTMTLWTCELQHFPTISNRIARRYQAAAS
jgi:DNA mismatch endonuclease (patch repair protein)